jgi:hypothetical protein
MIKTALVAIQILKWEDVEPLEKKIMFTEKCLESKE